MEDLLPKEFKETIAQSYDWNGHLETASPKKHAPLMWVHKITGRESPSLFFHVDSVSFALEQRKVIVLDCPSWAILDYQQTSDRPKQ